MFARTAVLISIVIVLQVIVLVAVDAEIDAHVDKILDEMSAEDDAYGVEPQSTLKNLKSVVDIDDFITV